MKILVTGADGFIGKNLRLLLSESSDLDVVQYTRSDSQKDLASLLNDVDFVIHLAGVNRSDNERDFQVGNSDLTSELCDALLHQKNTQQKPIPVIYTSSIQATQNNSYGKSKRAAELALKRLASEGAHPIHIYRLPNVFGKWARPNYNSAVVTFCHNIARGQPIEIHDSEARVKLVYIDDVLASFIRVLDGEDPETDVDGFALVKPEYSTNVSEIAGIIQGFRQKRDDLLTAPVGTGLRRALYSTYVSYLPTEEFSYSVPIHEDARGVFVEMLKTEDSGQFSYFTAHPGVTRGGHYHHSKTEKFLVITGKARFRFRHMESNESYEILTCGSQAEIVETVPGWTHDITNIGDDEMAVMLWANEIFDQERPDTIACPL